MSISNIAFFFRQLFRESITVSSTLFRVMIPTILILKVFEELGGVTWLSQLLAPVMEIVGLPGELGMVWATALLVNIYSSLMVLVNLNMELSVAQMSILGSMILLAHSIPVEGAISRKAGVSFGAMLLIRIGGTFLFAVLLRHIYDATGALQQPAHIMWQPGSTETGLMPWILAQIKSLAMIYVVITVLMLALKILKLMGIEKLMAFILSPLLKLLGISKEATNLTIIGITLGLSYGGGLLINEARKGVIKPRDIFCSIILLNLFHSAIEDTLLILLLGADFTTIFWGRMVFSILLVAALSFALRMLNEKQCEMYLYHSVSDH